MNAANQYLEKAKLEEIKSRLVTEGYQLLSPGGRDRGFDILARKGERTLAVAVKVTEDLRHTQEQLRQLRQRAREEGYEFTLVIATPPRPVEIDIPDFEGKLLASMKKERPAGLSGALETAVPDSVGDIQFDKVEVTKDGVTVHGSGVVEVEIPPWGKGEGATGGTSDAYGFTFDSALSPTLDILRSDVIVDTSEPDT